MFHLLFEYSCFKAMAIIAKLSFWKKPSITTRLSQQFEEVILDALAQFRTDNYAKKLQTSITQESLPSNKDDLLEFMYNQITHT